MNLMCFLFRIQWCVNNSTNMKSFSAMSKKLNTNTNSASILINILKHNFIVCKNNTNIYIYLHEYNMLLYYTIT